MGILSQIRQCGDPGALGQFLSRIPYARFLGIEIVPKADGFVTRLPFDPKLVGNPHLPALHGGVLGAFLELTAIAQLLWEGEGEGIPKPIDVSIDYLRSAGPKDTFARAVITKHGRRVANVRSEAWQDDPSRPVAASHAHFLLPTSDRPPSTETHEVPPGRPANEVER
jgi:acyl-coenzyme A thioesterase PaaI-like protein